MMRIWVRPLLDHLDPGVSGLDSGIIAHRGSEAYSTGD
jgi:hypothetical protein